MPLSADLGQNGTGHTEIDLDKLVGLLDGPVTLKFSGTITIDRIGP